ncbi:hypothetical protein GAC87_13415 [Bacteroides thetaiotaomicron]|nr:hypothetical protein GAN71_01490 [Bacteroides thetaiotaomicron]KAB4495821.1 hypothetical protein GAN60_13765 [Bacteroides thetaiotaomicron]KAB4503499.1 hypothetical protein GAN85_04600 [Bacteroides thetaiotaomicron]KAB4512622.1 hypothetical protein GAN72_04680 [Bacteroides thetaiotaomicron]KAB4516465.1 hypothetical protein GAN78_04665 [Bacteroides thetaiotaomicron]
MEPLETHFKGIILSNLYRDPRKKRIQHDIMDELQTKLFPEQLISYRKQLVMEGLITEEEPDEVHSLVEITPKGYEAIQTFGSYQAYIANQQKAIKLQRESEIMKSRYLRLKTISIVITTLLSILSFITVQSPNQKIPDRKTKCVIKTHINIKQNVIFGAKLKPV